MDKSMPLFKLGTRVALVHGIALVTLFLIYYGTYFQRPLPNRFASVKISFARIAPRGSGKAGATVKPTPPPQPPTPAPPTPQAKQPEPPKPPPKEVPQPIPKEIPKPVAKEAQKLAPRETLKPAPKETAKTVSTAKPKPAPHYRTAEEIRKSATLSPPKSIPPESARDTNRDARTDASARQDAVSPDVGAKLDRMIEMVGGLSDGEEDAANSYYQLVRDQIDSLWNQPNRADVGNDDPEAIIELEIDRRGRVLSKRILSASGNSAMDGSASRLLDALSSLPAFPTEIQEPKMTLRIRLNLE